MSALTEYREKLATEKRQSVDDGQRVTAVDAFNQIICAGTERDVWDASEDFPAGSFILYGNGAEVAVRYWMPQCILEDRP